MMFFKHTLEAGFGLLIHLLQWVCGKRGVYFEKVNSYYTSQVCPNCDARAGEKNSKSEFIIALNVGTPGTSMSRRKGSGIGESLGWDASWKKMPVEMVWRGRLTV